MKIGYSVTALFCLLCLGWSCEKQTLDTSALDFGYEYFPLEVGRSWTYRVDSIIFDPAVGATAVDTVSGFFREQIVDTLRSQSGDLLYLLNRDYRSITSDTWQPHKVATLARDQRQAWRTEDNLRITKLVFPPRPGKQWRATAAFDEFTEIVIAGERLEFFKGWESVIIDAPDAFSVAGRTYPDTRVVQIADFENKIEYRYGQEVYAPDIGMIYRELWVLDTQCEYCCNRDLAACDDLPWVEKAEKGVIVRQWLVE